MKSEELCLLEWIWEEKSAHIFDHQVAEISIYYDMIRKTLDYIIFQFILLRLLDYSLTGRFENLISSVWKGRIFKAVFNFFTVFNDKRILSIYFDWL